MYEISIKLKCSKTLNNSADRSEQKFKGTHGVEEYELLHSA